MSHTIKSLPFDLKLDDEVKIIVVSQDKSVTGKISMAAAPIYEIKLDDGDAVEAGMSVRCEPTKCPRQSRILATVIGNKEGDTKIWITAMELQVGVEREPRYPALGTRAMVGDGVGGVELKDVSNSGLSFLTDQPVTPGRTMDISVLNGDNPVELEVMTMHVSQEVGMPIATVGCKITRRTDGDQKAWAEIVKRSQEVASQRPKKAS